MAVYRQKLITLSNTCSAAGVNTIIAAPPTGKRILIAFLKVQLGIASAQTILIKSGNTQIWNFIGSDLGDGEVEDFVSGEELPCNPAEALIFDLTVAKIVYYVVRYYVE